MNIEENSLNVLRRQLTTWLFVILVVSFSIFGAYYLIQNIILLALVHFFLVMINALYFVLIVKKIYKYSLFMGLYLVYIVFSIFFIILNAVIMGQHESQFSSLWLFVLPIATMAFTNYKMAFYISIVSALSQLIIMLLWRIFEASVYIPISGKQIYIVNFLTILTVIVACVYSFYSAWRMNMIKEILGKSNIKIETKIKEFEKYQKIYNQIIACFEEKKLYENPELTLSEVAEHLNTNVTYIQRALKYHRQDANFNNFVNQYRISAIKKAIAQEEHNKYTIGYLYQMAGFRYQSTFNKVFKQFEGMTPSEYISLLKSKSKKERGRKKS
ncbi:hypothetical protein FACS189432_06130 [Bacteroidia bacterium]|nr:hypothetical protein FACS189426_18130 [Bacteroidia bacterium]GHT28334.1 hypothetical protein FACS189432_06130 [Bacteroidia bacterium]